MKIWYNITIRQDPDSVYIIPRDENASRVKIRSLERYYCEQKGILPKDLSPAETEQVLVRS